VKRVNESIALGYIASRTVESILVLVGVVSLMSVVALRQDVADAANSSGALIGVLLGANPSGLPVALTAPEAIWELSLSVWLLARGFRPSPVLSGPPAVPREVSPASAAS